MEWWIAACAAVFAASAACTAWQLNRLLHRLGRLADGLDHGASEALKEIASAAEEVQNALHPVHETAMLAKRQLERLDPLLEAADSLRVAADTAGAAARRIADQAAGTADAAAERVRRAAGKYRTQLEDAIGIADAALEGWMYIRTAAAKLKTPACSDREIGNPNAERRD